MMRDEDRIVHPLLKGRITVYVNAGLCIVGAVFIVVGVVRSTLLLYVGCAFIGAAIGGFIRSRLPIHSMVPPSSLAMIYRTEWQRNMQGFPDGMQTFMVVHGNQPQGVNQRTIDEKTTIKKFKPSMAFLQIQELCPLGLIIHNMESFDRISMTSTLTEKTEKTDSDEPCCIICFLPFKRGQDVRQLPCQHIYHIKCIDRWLKINCLCPTCREDITGKTIPLPMHNFFVETVTANVAPESQITASVDIEAADPPESMSQEASAVNSNTANASNTTDSDINEDNVSVTVNVDDQGSSPVQWITDSLVETELTDGLDIVTEPAQEALQMEPESSDGDVIMTVTNS